MSITACETCDKWIDEDYDVEHFEICKLENEVIKSNERKQ